MNKKILILNASLRGNSGNSHSLAQKIKNDISNKADVEIYNLVQPKKTIQEVYSLLESADGFIVITGTYWNNVSSILQRFFEICTQFENTPAFLGKPVSVVVSMDSVGGIDVASKISEIFGGLGCWTPPHATVVLSRVGEDAARLTKNLEDDPNADVWVVEDILILIENMLIACQVDRSKWVTWSCMHLKLNNLNTWPETGELEMGNPKFL